DAPGASFHLPVDGRRVAGLLPKGPRPVDARALAVPVMAARDEGRFGQTAGEMIAAGRRLVPRLAACLALARDPAGVERALAKGRVAAIVGDALGARHGARGRAAIDVALVLCADHE